MGTPQFLPVPMSSLLLGHPVSVSHMQNLFSTHGLFIHFAPQIAGLPDHTPLTKADLLVPRFLLHEGPTWTLRYAPFDYVNEQARVVIVGIAPGWYQTEMAFRLARNALHEGQSLPDASRYARQNASFSGPIRKTLVSMLDGIGLHHALGIETCWQLYSERADLLHTTAAVRYPIFVGNQQNYAGYTPSLFTTPLLRRFVVEVLGGELQRIPDALVIAVGKSVGEALQLLVAEGWLEAERCLIGMPHPSGANAHRPAQFARMREELAARVQDWYNRRGAEDAEHV